MTGGERTRIAAVELDGGDMARLTALRRADLGQAVADLTADGAIDIPNHVGPYVLRLALRDGRLLLGASDAEGGVALAFGLALGRIRRLLRDYDVLVESHETAVQEGREARIQAIDMGRRGLHNEAAAHLRERLAGRVALDLDTARRLFTLIAVLHDRA